MPDELREISGIDFLNDSVVAAISDGQPYLYFYNLKKKEILNKIMIADDGDFEDVTVCGNTIYILQSNGKIWMVNYSNQNLTVINSYSLSLQQPFELEGLCHNSANDTLFIAAKYWQEDEDAETALPVWAYSVKDKKLIEKPLFTISSAVASVKKKHLFHTSGIVLSNDQSSWLAISTNKKYITQLSRNGAVEKIIILERDEFIQPEGIAIDRFENLYISNEGKDGKGTILKFNKKTNAEN